MRPCTPHYVLGIEPTIVHGRHFYSTSSIASTCCGIIHTFVQGYQVTNHTHSQTRTLLRRLLTVWINYYMAEQEKSGTLQAS